MTDALKYIALLSNDNYSAWEVRIKALLVKKGLWQFIGPTKDEDEQVDSEKFEQALALMILALGEDQMVFMEECMSARKGRRKLKSIYAEPSIAN